MYKYEIIPSAMPTLHVFSRPEWVRQVHPDAMRIRDGLGTPMLGFLKRKQSEGG